MGLRRALPISTAVKQGCYRCALGKRMAETIALVLVSTFPVNHKQSPTMTTEDILNRQITLSVRQILFDLLGSGRHVKISNDMAALLSVIDDAEQLVHIEWPNAVNSFDSPVLWNIREWRESYDRHCRIKEFAELQRQVRLHEQDTIRRFKKQLDHHFPPICHELELSNHDESVTQVRKRNLNRLRFYNVKFDELLLADKALAAFESKLKAQRKENKP